MYAELALASQALLTRERNEELQRKHQEAEAKTKYIKQVKDMPTTMIYATTSAGDPVVLGVWEGHIDKNLGEVLSDLGALLSQDGVYNEDFLKPNNEAVGFAWQLLDKTGKQLEGGFPLGTIYPDGSGGLRVEWIRPNAEVRLIIPSSEQERGYIYYEFGNKYDADYNLSPANLAHWLKQLDGNNPAGT